MPLKEMKAKCSQLILSVSYQMFKKKYMNILLFEQKYQGKSRERYFKKMNNLMTSKSSLCRELDIYM